MITTDHARFSLKTSGQKGVWIIQKVACKVLGTMAARNFPSNFEILFGGVHLND
jgi:hypothetical protein